MCVTSYIENQGGEIKTVDRWGRRRLAYPINKKFNGFYVHIEFDAAPNAVPVIERFYVLEDTILRHLTLVLPEELKDLRTKKAMERGNASVTPFDEDKKDDKKENKKDAPADKAPVEDTPTEKKEEPKEAEVAEESKTEEN
jgi:small subunit ribosomal protein S6